MAYNDTHLDVHRIKQYAKRVAKETKHPLQSGFDIEWRATSRLVEEIVETKRLFGLITSAKKVPRSVTGRNVTASIGPHWQLHKRNYHFDSATSDYSRYYTWVLLHDGLLKFVYHTEEYFKNQRPRREPEFGGLVEDMTAEHMLRLDHEPQRFHRHISAGEPGHEWGDYPDGPIIRHAKGVGISLALKNLIEPR